MLIISGRAYKRKCIWLCTFTAIVYALMLPDLDSQTSILASHIPQIKPLFTALTYIMRGTIVLIACRTLYEGLTLHRPLVVADETGLRVHTGSWFGGVRSVRWDEIGRADVSTIYGPEALWNCASRWQWRTITFYAADPAHFARQGWRGKIRSNAANGAVIGISEAMAGPQFGDLIDFANSHIRKAA